MEPEKCMVDIRPVSFIFPFNATISNKDEYLSKNNNNKDENRCIQTMQLLQQIKCTATDVLQTSLNL